MPGFTLTLLCVLLAASLTVGQVLEECPIFDESIEVLDCGGFREPFCILQCAEGYAPASWLYEQGYPLLPMFQVECVHHFYGSMWQPYFECVPLEQVIEECFGEYSQEEPCAYPDEYLLELFDGVAQNETSQDKKVESTKQPTSSIEEMVERDGESCEKACRVKEDGSFFYHCRDAGGRHCIRCRLRGNKCGIQRAV